MLRGLRHHWRANLAVALGAAAACTVLTGALLAGDSVRGSLVDLTLDRLGGIDSALVAERFFRERLADELTSRGAARHAPTAEGGRGVAPLVALRSSAVAPESGRRAARIALYGVDRRFVRMHHGGSLPELERDTAGIFPPLVINHSLATELEAGPGDELVLSFERPGEVPRETLLGDREAEDVLVGARFRVARVIPDTGLGGFGFAAQQARPRNAFVSLALLQRLLGREGRVNALVASGEGADPRPALRLEDLGLRVVRGTHHVSLETDGFFLKPAAVAATQTLASELRVTPHPVFTYLATSLRVAGRSVPYSMVAGLSSVGAIAPKSGEVVLNEWAADDLAARRGDVVELRYLVMSPGGGLAERRADLRVAGVVAMVGAGADRSLTPAFPGIENTADIAAWDPPFPVELSRIRPKDEEYWDVYGPSPKAFVSLDTARRLWSTRFGDLTSVRFEGSPGELDRIERALVAELPARIDPAPFGLVFRPVKREGLAAARGSTDFASLFLAFSSFLVVSAVLLAGLLFSLAVQRRAGEMGALLAVGYPLRAVRRRFLGEGLVLAGVGALLGLGGACGYAWLLMAALRTWWLPAVGTSELYLHVEPWSLLLGWIASVLAVLLAIGWTVRRLARLPVTALLARRTVATGPSRPALLLRMAALGGAAAAIGLVLLIVLSQETASPALTFGAGSATLLAGLAAISLWLRKPPPARDLTLLGMAARNGTANPGRSLLSVTLVAAASFVLVSVAANRRSAAEATASSGGFALVGESAVPLSADPGEAAGRLALGLEEGGLSGASLLSLRLVPGEDASCLNLYRPVTPRLLGVPPRSLSGRFDFRRSLLSAADPWDLLERDLAPGVIPAIADESSATWILKLALGKDLVMAGEGGEPIRLRLVALLNRSPFQSEVLVAEKHLLRHFPSRAGRSFFLIAAPPDHLAEVSRSLEEGLSRYGLDVSTTAARVAAYEAVEATYLQTFGALGGFGLLLGTLGSGIAMLRGVVERRGELGALRAFGYRRRRLAWMVTAENGFLLLLGVGLGTAAGLVAVGPRLAEAGGSIPWRPLLATLLGVLVVGVGSSLGAVWTALRAPLTPVLKEE